jgi:hypothetical protein
MIPHTMIINGQFKILERITWSTNMAGMDISKEDIDE